MNLNGKKKTIIKQLLIYYIKIIFCFLFKLVYIFPIKKNRIIFSSYSGRQYSCNPKYIFEKLVELYPNKFEVFWVANVTPNIPRKEAKYLTRNTLRYCYYMLTAHVIIDNVDVNAFLPYRKEQLKINTWHGGGAYKKIGVDINQTKPEYLRLIRTGKATDIVLSSSERFSEAFVSSHHIDLSKMWEIGMPRNDVFFRLLPDMIQNTRKKIGIGPDEKLIIYAPTYRRELLNVSFKTAIFDIDTCLDALQKRFMGKWILGFRMHYAYDSHVKTIPHSINLSSYPDMQELLLVADVLITDYSSSIWDFSFTKRPCFIYANDLEQYKSDVDFYTPIEQWPFPMAQNNDQLVQNILNFDQDSYLVAVNQHYKDLGSCETGHASETVAKAIYDYCFNNISKEDVLKYK